MEASARRSRGEGEVERGGVTAMEVVIEKRQRPRPNSRGVREVMTTRRMREEEEREDEKNQSGMDDECQKGLFWF